MSDEAPDPAPAPVAPTPWLRLDPRMLLLQPLTELARFLPALIPLLLFGTASGFGPWAIVGVAAPLALGVARYLTTSYRIVEGRIELRRGVLQRRTTSARLERVRTVDMTATLGHRVLGVSKLVIGTGTGGAGDEDDLELDGLARDRAAELRTSLLERPGRAEGAGEAPRSGEEAPGSAAEPDVRSAPVVAARFSPRWLLYAPFTSAGFIAAAALIGFFAQAFPSAEIDLGVDNGDVPRLGVILVVLALVAVLIAATLLVIGGYLFLNWGFTLSRLSGSWQVRRGLTTTRETSLDVDRVAGVSVAEGAALRIAHGARLSAIVTGLGSGGSDSAILVPPAPGAVVRDAAAAVLGSAAPVAAELRPHGPAAVRRRWTRALTATLPVHLLVVAAILAFDATPFLLGISVASLAVAALLAHDRSRGLGHGWIAGYVVMRSGSLARRRTALGGGHVIGWTVRESWFQRRVGLVTLTATTAGGSGRTEVDDIPTSAAYRLAEEATPGLLGQFRSDQFRPELAGT
ncbi:PH domain-containing protein [Nocardioides sp. BGMRC 2183]|nr:PH domain-containing protein [Nocardioides sp. BGMRC 2183]